jgi:hypothetical protein
MVNSDELIGTTEYLTVETMCRINRCRYKRVRLYIILYDHEGDVSIKAE